MFRRLFLMVAMVSLGAGCNAEDGGAGTWLEGNEAAGTVRVESGEHTFLQLRECADGQVLRATEQGWECAALPDPSAELAAKANRSEVEEALAVKADAEHTHPAGEVTGLTEAITAGAEAAIAAGVPWDALTDVPAEWPGQVPWARITDAPDLAALQQTIATLEQAVEALQQSDAAKDALIAALQRSDATQAGQIEALLRANTAKSEQITALQANDAAQAQLITALQQADEQSAQQLAALQQRDTEQTQQLATLQANDTAQGQQLTAQGQQLTAQGQQLTALQQELDALQDQVCPRGWEDAGDPTAPICSRVLEDGTVDEMVRIGDFLIDRYEASLWNRHALDLQTGQPVAEASCVWAPPTGMSGTCFGDLVSRNGVGVTGIPVSTRGTRVLHSVNWFQAQALCANAGKRLCTAEEWQVAAQGTPDTGNGNAAPCNINNVLPQAAAGQADTGWAASNGKRYRAGASALCVSDRGVFDLVGNVWEWVAWWTPAGGTVADWSDGEGLDRWGAGFGGDRTWNLNGRADRGDDWQDGLPAAALRGGAWNSAAFAGAYALDLSDAPTAWRGTTGFRCCRGN